MSRCSKKCRVVAAVGLAVILAGGAGAYLFVKSQEASAKESLGRNWRASERVSMNRIGHSRFDKLLKKHVDGDGYVDYSAWKKSAADRRELQTYLAELGRADLNRRESKQSQLAFWINAYNAVTIEGILQVYPTSSIRKHTSRFGGYNIWKHLPLTVGGKKFSLNDIEHKILRNMGEPRIHFAIVCASVGCPRIRNEAYTADKLNAQLKDNTQDFFSRSKNFQVERGTIKLSSILKWFGSDFGGSKSAVLSYIRPYLPKTAQPLANSRTRVEYLDYDWRLNDQRSKPSWDRAVR